MIDIVALKNKILELAVCGRLTKQLESDGTAEELFVKIQAEKAKMIKEGRIKKKKALQEIADDEIPFKIPGNWKWVRFAELCEIINGDRGKNYPAKSTLKKVGIPFISALNLDGKSVIENENLLCMDEEQYGKLGSGKLQQGDIIICIRGSLGKHGKYPFDKGAIASSLVISRVYFAADIIGDYEMLWLDSLIFQRQIEKYDGGTAQPNLAANNLEKFLFPLPPLEEQERIVKKVSEVFEVLETIDELQSRYLSDAKVLKSKLIDAGIQGKLTEQLPEDGTAEDLYAEIQAEKAKILKSRKGREDKRVKGVNNDVPFEIPSHWKWIRLGDIGLFKKGPFGSALTKSMFVQKGTGTVKVYEQQHAIKKDCELGTYYISREYFNEKMSGFEVMPGDIIVSCAGTIGETYIMPNKIEQGIINQALMRVTLAEGIDKKFFQYYFDANLKKSAQEESNGSAIKNIPPFDVLKNWYFPLTSIEEQRRIVVKLDELLTSAII